MREKQLKRKTRKSKQQENQWKLSKEKKWRNFVWLDQWPFRVCVCVLCGNGPIMGLCRIYTVTLFSVAIFLRFGRFLYRSVLFALVATQNEVLTMFWLCVILRSTLTVTFIVCVGLCVFIRLYNKLESESESKCVCVCVLYWIPFGRYKHTHIISFPFSLTATLLGRFCLFLFSGLNLILSHSIWVRNIF